MFEQKEFCETEHAVCHESVSELLQYMENDGKKSVIVTVTNDGESISLSFLKAAKDKIEKDDIERLGSSMSEWLKDYQYTQSRKLFIESESIVSSVNVKYSDMVTETTGIFMSKASVIIHMFVSAYLVMLVIQTFMLSSDSIITEKTMKISDTLLISIRPSALLLGKMIGALVTAFIRVACELASGCLSAVLYGKNLSNSFFVMLSDNILQGVSMADILLAVLQLLLGTVLFTTIACIFGATAERVEESGEALLPFYILIYGAYIFSLAVFFVSFFRGNDKLLKFAVLCPFTSPFVVVATFGKNISAAVRALSVVLLLVTLAAAIIFAAKSFETVYMHKGERLGLKELVKLVCTADKKVNDNE